VNRERKIVDAQPGLRREPEIESLGADSFRQMGRHSRLDLRIIHDNFLFAPSARTPSASPPSWRRTGGFRVPPSTQEILRETGEKAGSRVAPTATPSGRNRRETPPKPHREYRFTCNPYLQLKKQRIMRPSRHKSFNCESPILRLLARLSKGPNRIVRKVGR
jgi:hypothetical protein